MRRKSGSKGTDNVLADLGFEDAEDLTAKALLAVKLNKRHAGTMRSSCGGSP